MVLSGPAPRVPPNGGLALSLVPHDGRVYIDDSGEGQLVTHTLTLRQQMAPIEGGPWSLHMDSDGLGALLSDSGETVILLEEWLTRQLYQCDEGDWIVLQAGEGKSQPASSWNLTARMREFVAHPIFLNNGAGQSQVTAFLMEWPRGGFKWQWPAQDLYRVLGMTSYKGQSSKWLYNSVSVWEAAMEAFGFQGHFVRSEASKPPDIGMSSVKYCLPSTSMSTLAVFVLLVQWQARSARRGGLRQDRDRHRCSALLRTFVDGVLSVPFLLTCPSMNRRVPLGRGRRLLAIANSPSRLLAMAWLMCPLGASRSPVRSWTSFSLASASCFCGGGRSASSSTRVARSRCSPCSRGTCRTTRSSRRHGGRSWGNSRAGWRSTSCGRGL